MYFYDKWLDKTIQLRYMFNTGSSLEVCNSQKCVTAYAVYVLLVTSTITYQNPYNIQSNTVASTFTTGLHKLPIFIFKLENNGINASK